MTEKKRDIFDIILNIIIVLLAILAVYWLIKLIVGGSPELSEVNFVLIGMLAGLFVKLHREAGEIKVEMKHISKGVKEGFDKVKEDIGLIREDINIIRSIKEDMGLIKKKLKV